MLDKFQDLLNLIEWLITSETRWIIIGIILILITYKIVRDFIICLYHDLKFFLINILINPIKLIIKGITILFSYPSRVFKIIKLKDSQFNIKPSIDYSTY